jgi:hypothetical protein
MEKGKLNLIISSEALEGISIKCLMKKPANNNSYSPEQMKKITNSNNNFKRRKTVKKRLRFSI